MANEEKSKTVEFIYQKSNDYKIIYVNGVYGGLTNKGDIKFDLFHEYNPVPEADVYSVTEDGLLGERVRQKGILDNVFIRERLIGVIMTPQAVRSIGQWLISKADEYDKWAEETRTKLGGGEINNGSGIDE